jgi:hypothetical protein
MTQAEINVAAAALHADVDRILEATGRGWEEWLIPISVYATGAADIIKGADGAEDQTPAGRVQAGQAALRAALDSTGQGSQVTDAQCRNAAADALSAVTRVRAKQTANKGAFA